MQQVTGQQVKARADIGREMFSRRMQHVLREIDGDDAPLRQSGEEFGSQPSGAAASVEDEFIPPEVQTREDFLAPTDLRSREAVVDGGIPLAGRGLGNHGKHKLF